MTDVEAMAQGNHKVYCKSDTSNSYWGVPINPEHIHLTAWNGPNGQFAYTTCPQGTRCSMNTYARFGDLIFGWLPAYVVGGIELEEHKSVLGTDKKTGCTLAFYVDDHTTSGESFDALFRFMHEKYMPRVAFGPIPLSAKKTVFFSKSVETTGFYIKKGRIYPAKKFRNKFSLFAGRWRKTPPTSWEDVQAALFITPFLRIFIPGRAALIDKIKTAFFDRVPKVTKTGKKSVSCEWIRKTEPTWGQEHLDALVLICNSITNNAVRAINFSRPLHLATNACPTGLGAILFQMPEGHKVYNVKHFDKIQINMFMSFSLHNEQRRYSMPKLETFAILKALDSIRWVTIATPYTIQVYTDHYSIKQSLADKMVVHEKLFSWIKRINKYNLEIHHRPNTDKIIQIADGLSRLQPPFNEPLPEDRETLSWNNAIWGSPAGTLKYLMSGTVENDKTSWFREMTNFMNRGEAALQGLTKNRARNIRRRSLRFLIRDGLLYRREIDGAVARCLMDEEVGQILKWAHMECGHYSAGTTLHLLKGKFWWPTRNEDVQKFCQECPDCQRVGPRQFRLEHGKTTILKPLQLVGMDFAGPIRPLATNGMSMVLVAVNYFTQFVMMKVMEYPVSAADVGDTWLFDWSPFFGWPAATITDNGSHFASVELKNFFAKRGTMMRFGPVTHPQTTGLPENTVKLLKKQLQLWALTTSKDRWPLWHRAVPAIVNKINNRYIRRLNISPSMVMMGMSPLRTPVELEEMRERGVQDELELAPDGAEQNRADAVQESREILADRLAEQHDAWDDPRRYPRIPMGTLVLERRDKQGGDPSKLEPVWKGPLIVVEQSKNRLSVKIKRADGTGPTRKIHIYDIKIWREPDDELTGLPSEHISKLDAALESDSWNLEMLTAGLRI